MSAKSNLLSALLLSMAVQTASAQSLCASGETVVWSCGARRQLYSVCASKDLGATSGYMQYRAGKPGKLDLAFPAKEQHPRGLFKAELLARGAMMSFTNGQYTYQLFEPLAGNSSMQVSKGSTEIASFECNESSSDTLTLTTILNLLKLAGVMND